MSGALADGVPPPRDQAAAAFVARPGEGQIATQLRWACRPIQHLLDNPAYTDLHINGAGPDGPTKVFTKGRGRRESHVVPLTAREIASIGRNAVVLGRQRLTRAMPFAPGVLPDKQRVNVAADPALPAGQMALSIRRTATASPTREMLRASGVFDRTVGSEKVQQRHGVEKLLGLKEARNFDEFIHTAFELGFSGVFAGPVNTGKTFNMRAYFHSIPLDRRIIAVADADELEDMPQHDVVKLLYPKDGGDGRHSAEHCTEAGLRMDMDEFINTEIRDGAAWALMRAGAGGHAFKSSCHAPSAAGAFHSLMLMAKQHPVGRTLDKDDLLASLYQLIDFVVFSELVDGKRRITQVWFDPSTKHGIPKAVTPALSAKEE